MIGLGGGNEGLVVEEGVVVDGRQARWVVVIALAVHAGADVRRAVLDDVAASWSTRGALARAVSPTHHVAKGGARALEDGRAA